MIFDAHHYVPILKLKRGEKSALGLLPSSVRSRVTPFLEIVERKKDKTLQEHLQTAFKGLTEAVDGFDRCFIDTREIAPDGPAGAEAVFQWAANTGIHFTPVTGITRAADITAALDLNGRGLALRLEKGEFEAGDLSGRVNSFLLRYGLNPENIDLIIDLGAVDTMVSAGVRALATAFLEEVPNHGSWRTFIISACAFPSSMRVVERHTHEFVQRADWRAWRDGMFLRGAALHRLPTYSDGGIQHPSGVEGFDPRIMSVSASIRYMTDDSWLLIKGESTRRTPPSEQFPLLATKLVFGHLHAHYCGANHCRGCSGMMNCATGQTGYGSAEAWRRLGTVHHITKVVEDLDALPWP